MTGPRKIISSLWQGAGLWWLLLCLAGLAAGLWPDALVYPKTPRRMLPLPTLASLATAQVAFLLLVYPLITLWRTGRGHSCSHGRRVQSGDCCSRDAGDGSPDTPFCPGLAALELLTLVLVALPFQLVAAYFADAGVLDVVRVLLTVAGFVPLCVGLCLWILPSRSSAARATASLAGLVVVAAMPAGLYICSEFLRASWAESLWRAAPLTLAWANGLDVDGALPTSVAAIVAWVAIGLCAMVAAWMTTARTQTK